MDCCDNNHRTSKKDEDEAGIKDSTNNRFVETKQLKGGEIKMNKRMVLWVVIGILFLAVLYLTFKVNTLDVNAVQSAGSAVQSAASSGAMVGGC